MAARLALEHALDLADGLLVGLDAGQRLHGAVQDPADVVIAVVVRVDEREVGIDHVHQAREAFLHGLLRRRRLGGRDLLALHVELALADGLLQKGARLALQAGLLLLLGTDDGLLVLGEVAAHERAGELLDARRLP